MPPSRCCLRKPGAITMIRKASIELAVAIPAAILSVFGALHASSFPQQTAYLPTAVLSIMSLLLVLWAFQSVMILRQNQLSPLILERGKTRRFLLLILSTAALIALAPILGFVTSFFIFVPLSGFILGYKYWKPLLAAGTIFSVLIYLIFQVLLGRPLPPELFIHLF